MARLLFLYLALFTVFTLGSRQALAQETSSEVIIDMSVLQAIDDYYASENVDTVKQPAFYPPFPAHKPNIKKSAIPQITAKMQITAPPLPTQKPKNTTSRTALKSGPNNMPAVAPTKVETEIIVTAPAKNKNTSSVKPDNTIKDIGSSLSPSLYFNDYDYVNISPNEHNDALSSDDVVKRKTPPKPQIENIGSANTPDTSSTDTSSKTELTLIYEAGSKTLTPDAKEKLNIQVKNISKKPEDWRIQINAFASSLDQSESSARRMSLSRALSLREYFMDKNIAAKRIDIKALGQNGHNNNKDAQHPDRVDIIFYDPNR